MKRMAPKLLCLNIMTARPLSSNRSQDAMMRGLNRLKPAVLYGIGLALLALILLYLGIRPNTTHVQDHVGEATIAFAADRLWLESADDCVQIIWKVSGIRQVALNDNSVADEGQAQQCSVLNKD